MLSQELEQFRTQLTVVTAKLAKSKEASTGNVHYYSEIIIMWQQCIFEINTDVFTTT